MLVVQFEECFEKWHLLLFGASIIEWGGERNSPLTLSSCTEFCMVRSDLLMFLLAMPIKALSFTVHSLVLSYLWSACHCCKLLSLARFVGNVLLMCDEN